MKNHRTEDIDGLSDDVYTRICTVSQHRDVSVTLTCQWSVAQRDDKEFDFAVVAWSHLDLWH